MSDTGLSIALALLSFNTALQVWIVQKLFNVDTRLARVEEHISLTNNRLDKLEEKVN